MAQTVVGLDIGASSIKITKLEVSLFGHEFLEFSEHPLPQNVDLPWGQLVSNVLQVLFADRGLSAEKVIVSIPGRYVSTRLLRLPFGDKRKIAQVLPFEMEGLIPLPLEAVVLDYEILATDPEGAWVFVLFTEKKLLEEHLQLLQEAGIDPYSVIPAPVALANLWKEIPLGEEEICAIVDMGEQETSLCLLRGRSIQYARSWAVGASSLTCAIQEGLEIPLVQAREKKEKEADIMAPPTPGGDSMAEWLTPIIRKSLDPIVGGIGQSLFSVCKSSGLKLQKIYTCGKASNLKGLNAYLSEELQIETAPLPLTGPAGNVLKEIDCDPAAAAVSLGLAFHGVREMWASRLNLRSGDYVYVSERTEMKKQLISTGVMVSVLLVMVLMLFGFQFHERSGDLRQIHASMENMALETFPELKDVPPGKQRISAMNLRLELERRERDMFAPLSPDSMSVLDILREITQAVPKDVTIDVRELSMDGNDVRIEAQTDSFNAAEQVKQNLMSSGLFSSADIPEAKDSVAKQAKVKFRMVLKLKQKIL